MIRASALVLIAACGPAPAAAKRPQTTPPDLPVVAAVPPLPAVISRPDSTIAMIAVTLDGTAAVTFGEGGDSRLWPALDGRLEPRVLDLLSLALITPDGANSASLAAESSQRIAAIAYAATRDIALVQLDTDTGRGVRMCRRCARLFSDL
ncbi:hypothetical protein BH11MYX2_BH11MYX2_13330 [soil metagenome]